MECKSQIHFLIKYGLLSILVSMLLGCASWEKMRTKYNQDYFAVTKDLDSSIVNSITRGKVVIGMTPDEAMAAGGPFFYEILPDRSKWGGGIAMSRADIRYYIQWEKNGRQKPRMPLEVIFLQRYEPDSSLISLTFNNTSQYETEDWVSFATFFINGRATRIQRTDDTEFKSLLKELTTENEIGSEKEDE